MQCLPDRSRFLRVPIWPDEIRGALYVAAVNAAREGETVAGLLGITDRAARLWGARATRRGWTPGDPVEVPFWPLPARVAASRLPVASKVAVAVAWRRAKRRGDGEAEAFAALERLAGAEVARALEVDPTTGARARRSALSWWHRSPDPTERNARSEDAAPLSVDQTRDRNARVREEVPTMDPKAPKLIPFPSTVRTNLGAASLGVQIGEAFRAELAAHKIAPLARESAWAPAWGDLAASMLETVALRRPDLEGAELTAAALDLARGTIRAFVGDEWARSKRWPAAALWNGARRWIPDDTTPAPRASTPSPIEVVIYRCGACGYGGVQRPSTGPIRRMCLGACDCETEWRPA